MIMEADLKGHQATRRQFLATVSAAVTAFMLPHDLVPGKSARMGIVVHSYGNRWKSSVKSQAYPGFANAIDLLEHCHDIGASGIQVGVTGWSTDFGKQVRDKREKMGMYVEGSIAMPFKPEEVAAFEREVAASKEAGALILRTVCTPGRRYEVFHSQAEFETAREAALNSLKLAEPVLHKHGVKLAVENHKDWRATELVELIKAISSEWIGVTLDFGNSIALMEEPLEVVETLAPYAFTTHVKDMGVDEYQDGILLSEVPLGKGILDLTRIVEICRRHNNQITFNLEMITRDPLQIPCLTHDYWQTFAGVGGSELARTLRMVKGHKFPGTLPMVSSLSSEARLAAEERNIIECLNYSSNKLGLK